MSEYLHSLTHGFKGFEVAYVLVQLTTFVALTRLGGASFRDFILSPLVAAPLTLFGMLVIALLSWPFPASSNAFVSILRIVLALGFYPVLGYSAAEGTLKPAEMPPGEYRRGAVVSSASRKRVRRDDQPGITLAGVPLALQDESKHFKLIGTTGTGKSTAIREILSGALARGDRVIIADPDGGYLARFYDAVRGDVILNPFDGAARKWDLFGEITNDYDVEQIARSLIPDNGASDRTWTEYARTFLTAVTQQAMAAGERSDRQLYRLITSASVEELRILLAGTAAGPFLESGNEKMFGSIRSIASSAVRALNYTTRQQAAAFSVRQWVRRGAARSAGGQGGALFFPYKAGEIAALRSVISAWMRIAIFEAMDREEADQHLWFVIDELDALGEIDGLKDALARLRKFGGRCILGLQSIAQVSSTYGRGVAETIVENCGNTLILRCSASERGGTSDFASKLIGQREVIHTTVSETCTHGELIPSTTKSQNLKIEPAIMASQIERLPDLQGFLKFASIPDWQMVALTPTRGAAPVWPRTPAVVTTSSTTPPTATPPGTLGAALRRSRKAKGPATSQPDLPLGTPATSGARSEPAPPPEAHVPIEKPPASAEWQS